MGMLRTMGTPTTDSHLLEQSLRGGASPWRLRNLTGEFAPLVFLFLLRRFLLCWHVSSVNDFPCKGFGLGPLNLKTTAHFLSEQCS